MVNDEKNAFMEILRGNWCNDSIGHLEELESDTKAIKTTVVDLLALLIDKKVINKKEVIDTFTNGWRIQGDD